MESSWEGLLENMLLIFKIYVRMYDIWLFGFLFRGLGIFELPAEQKLYNITVFGSQIFILLSKKAGKYWNKHALGAWSPPDRLWNVTTYPKRHCTETTWCKQ